MHASDRPTPLPEFDLERFAKDSDAKLRAVVAPEHSGEFDSELRVVASHATPRLSDALWASAMQGNLAVAISPEELRTLPLDHRAGFLLSQIDGTLDLESLLAIVPFPQEEAIALVRELYDRGVVDVVVG